MLKDAQERDKLIPDSFNPKGSLDDLLDYVPEADIGGRPKHGTFKIYLFSVGPSVQFYAENLEMNQAVIGYYSSSKGSSVVLYEILKDNNPKFKKYVLRT